MTAQLPRPLLPLRGSALLPVGLACRLQLAGLLLGLGWRGLAASSSIGPAACAVFPAAGFLRIFWASPALLACWGSWALYPVSGCSSCGVVCLVCRWGSPAAFSFPWSGCASG